jgi:hypothetical protein
MRGSSNLPCSPVFLFSPPSHKDEAYPEAAIYGNRGRHPYEVTNVTKKFTSHRKSMPPYLGYLCSYMPLPLTLTFREIKESEEKRREEKLLTIPASKGQLYLEGKGIGSIPFYGGKAHTPQAPLTLFQWPFRRLTVRLRKSAPESSRKTPAKEYLVFPHVGLQILHGKELEG